MLLAAVASWLLSRCPVDAVVLTLLMKEAIMRTLRGFLALVLLLGTVPVVWAQADPAKEVAAIRQARGQARCSW